jgi:alkylation response protein AidB-like acyl-CoA dehydrogenase
MEVCEIIDTWDVLGMRGTGSHDVAVHDVFVPEALTFLITPEVVPGTHYQGPLYRFSIIGIQAMVFPSVALAVVRYAIDAVATLAQGKTPAVTTTVLRERASAQAKLARAEALWRAGRACSTRRSTLRGTCAWRVGHLPCIRKPTSYLR